MDSTNWGWERKPGGENMIMLKTSNEGMEESFQFGWGEWGILAVIAFKTGIVDIKKLETEGWQQIEDMGRRMDWEMLTWQLNLIQ